MLDRSSTPGLGTSGSTAFTYGGDVVDKQGTPVSGVEVTATHHTNDRSYGYIAVVTTDAHGHFLINRERAISGMYADRPKEGTIKLRFSHPDFTYVTLEGLQTYNPSDATTLTVTLPEGREITGHIVSPDGQPVVGATAQITFPSGHEQRRGTTTDVQGRFTFRGLPEEAGTLQVLTATPDQPLLTAQAEVTATQTDAGTIVATPIVLPEGMPVHELFGMKLMDVDPSLQAAFHLPRSGGVLVLDPGSRGQELELQRGNQFWIVGDTQINDFADFTRQLLTLRTAPDTQPTPGATAGDRVRVVWNFSRPDFAGTNTQYLQLDSADISALTALQKN